MILFDASIFFAEGRLQQLTELKIDVEQTDGSITPRGAGTSLGGQAIGEGVVLDFRNCNRILGYDESTARVWVEPGVIQDDLNDFLRPFGRRFAPDTSTSNRATIGGMIGNNSCGMYSCHWGTTREHIHRIKVQLADGSLIWAGPLDEVQLAAKCRQDDLEGHIYRTVVDLVSRHREAILEAYPDPSVIRRNTGYALDVLARHHRPFNPDGKPFSLVPLLCGSEGTLGLFLEAELETVPLPERRDLVCAHFAELDTAFACLPALMETFRPAAVELLDAPTLEAARHNPEQAANRFWLEGQPQAVLAIELFDAEPAGVESLRLWLQEREAYATPHLTGAAMNAVWSLRKAGLGLLMGERTRKKAIAVVEDAAIPLPHLRDYYHDMRDWLSAHGVEAVFYGHASVGLIHIRPKLDLTQARDRALMVELARFSAERVRFYRGALSGEHGDGRIRAPFLREFFGEQVYQLNVAVKQAFDPQGRFNPGVIIGDAPITENLRADLQPQVEVDTGLDWSESLSLFDAVSRCNGAGACLKSPGRGVMCPSYQALRTESAVTRGRANLLRQALASPNPKRALKASDLQEAMNTCLACKACSTECSASVDMAALKMEWLYQTRPHGRLERWLLRHAGSLLKWGRRLPKVASRLQNLTIARTAMGVASQADLPDFSSAVSLPEDNAPEVLVLVDPYTFSYENRLWQAVLRVFRRAGIRASFKIGGDPVRLWLSQGLLEEARQALQWLADELAAVTIPIVSLEPSEGLVWRDEARKLGIEPLPDVKLLDEWLATRLEPTLFAHQSRTAWVHAHCHQKAARQQAHTLRLLEQVSGLKVRLLNTGCCGMAGDFGYRQPTLSRKVAQTTFLPQLEAVGEDDWLIATGFSCRHQARLLSPHAPLHPVEALAAALK